jgi:glutamate 5-kinase
VFDKNPHLYPDAKLIAEVSDMATVRSYIEERNNNLGTGGMTSKIAAAEICLSKNIEMYIVNGGKPNFIVDALAGRTPKTRFVPKP